tara:strand:+ start:493 stop:738 length:246 start_codon:yes stop_codon:yes gene_type:complete
MNAALLDNNDKVIGEVFDAPERGYLIEVAGCFTASGDPVNVRNYSISRSKVNMHKAQFEQPVTKVGNVYTFNAVFNNEVVY